MQRVHQEDLVGHLLEGGFEVLNLPAVAQRTESFELGNGRSYTRRKGELLLVRREVFYVLEAFRGNLPFEALKRKVIATKHHYRPCTLLIEDSPISRGLIQSLREQSINVTTYKPETDKRSRVIAQTDLFHGGSVRFPRQASWLEELTAELLAFPGRHDDQVDALIQALAWGRQSWGRRMSVASIGGLY